MLTNFCSNDFLHEIITGNLPGTEQNVNKNSLKHHERDQFLFDKIHVAHSTGNESILWAQCRSWSGLFYGGFGDGKKGAGRGGGGYPFISTLKFGEISEGWTLRPCDEGGNSPGG